MEITKYINDNYGNEKINLVCGPLANPYDTWSSLPVKFYLEKDMTYREIKNLCALNDTLFIDGAINLLIIRKADKENKKCVTKLNDPQLHFEIQSIPVWIEKLYNYYDKTFNRRILEMYRYE